MSTITIERPQLTDDDMRQAAEAADRIARGQELMPLSPAVSRLLSLVLNGIARGDGKALKAKISTAEAADYLNVSRPYVIRLLDEGRIAFHMVGSHRRIYRKDLEAFKAHQDEVSYGAMQDLQNQAQELGLYDMDPMTKHA